MLSRLTADQLDYLRTLASEASDHFAWNVISLAIGPELMRWIPNALELAAMRVCVAAFNAMGQRSGMEWLDGDPFPQHYTADDAACYRRTPQRVWAKGQDCMVYDRGAYVRNDSPRCVYIDKRGRILGTEA